MTKEELEAQKAQNQENPENPENQEQEEKDEFVPKKAYEGVSDSMHKYKRELKETKAELSRLKAEQEIREREAGLQSPC